MKLIEMLSKLVHEPIIILDLRNNHGGDFHAAIDSADLFVPPEKFLLQLYKEMARIHIRAVMLVNICNHGYSFGKIRVRQVPLKFLLQL